MREQVSDPTLVRQPARQCRRIGASGDFPADDPEAERCPPEGLGPHAREPVVHDGGLWNGRPSSRGHPPWPVLRRGRVKVWHLVVGKALVALASGVCITAMVVRTATSVDHTDTGTGLVQVTHVIGFAAGVQVGGAVIAVGTRPATDRRAT